MEVRLFAVYGLGRIHSEPEKVVPTLIKCLSDPYVEVQGYAVDALGNFRADAKSAVPVLIEMMQNPNKPLTSQVRTALLQIDPEAAAKADVK